MFVRCIDVSSNGTNNEHLEYNEAAIDLLYQIKKMLCSLAKNGI